MSAALTIAISADSLAGIAPLLSAKLTARGHKVLRFGALAENEKEEWASVSAQAARAVRDGSANTAIVCCHTGTGASIAANKIRGVRAALCADGYTAAGARRWNDANVLALSLRTVSDVVLDEILDGWFGTVDDGSQATSLAYLDLM